MPVIYRGVFSESMLSLEDALKELTIVFSESKLSFSGSVTRIGAGFSLDVSFYAEEGHDLEKGLQIDRIDQILPVVSKWEGISILCISDDLVESTGNSISGEMDFFLSRVEKGCVVAFQENRAANTCRREDPSLAQSFYQMLLGVCERLKVSYCVYGDAVSLEGLYPDASMVEKILKTEMLPEGGKAACVVFPAKAFVWEDVQKQAASYGRELYLSSCGYGVLKLLPPEE